MRTIIVLYRTITEMINWAMSYLLPLSGPGRQRPQVAGVRAAEFPQSGELPQIRDLDVHLFRRPIRVTVRTFLGHDLRPIIAFRDLVGDVNLMGIARDTNGGIQSVRSARCSSLRIP